MRRLPLFVLLALAWAPPASAASLDNDVLWSGVSHVAFHDRRPLCPVDRETFQVRIQTYRNDVGAVRVRVTAGASQWVAAALLGARGPYDVWGAQVPASATTALTYYFELVDGTDTDYYGPTGMLDADPGSGGFALDFGTLAHAPVGATLVSGGGAVFKVWAPTRTSVHVRGEFNGWGLGNPMTKVGEHWIARVASVSARQKYKYFFNGSHYNTDARARSVDPSDFMNSRIENPFGYAWAVSDFATPRFDQLVVYQLHVGTFAGRNDPLGGTPFPSRYVDVAARAAHLAELGVNAVMLNPITEFDGDLSAGYNPISQWAPEWRYGTPDELKAMIDAFHQNGIAVLLDIVWNHFSFNGNFMWNYDGSQIYFDNPDVQTPWGSQADFDRAPVREYFLDSALHWLEEFKIDGFRMDATDYMNMGSHAASGWSLMQRFNDQVDTRWASKVAVAEQLPNDDWVTRATSAGGAGFDAQYHDAFTDNLRQEILDAATGDPEMWKIRDLVNGSGPDLSGAKAFNYVELHDEAWPTNGGQRMVKTIDTTAPHDDAWAQGRWKLANGVLMFAPGIPAFLMGAEWLEDTPFGSDAANRIDWSKRTTYAPVFRWFQDIIALRRENPALWAAAGRHVHHVNEGANVIAFRRSDGSGNEVLVLANFSNTTFASYRIGAPTDGLWFEEVNSQASRYGGGGPENPGLIATGAVPYDGYPQSLAVALPAMGLLALAPARNVAVPAPSPTVAARPVLRVSPSPARGPATVDYELPAAGFVRIVVLDAAGRRVATLAEGEFAAGRHVARWKARDAHDRSATPGLYFVRLEFGGVSTVQRIALLR